MDVPQNWTKIHYPEWVNLEVIEIFKSAISLMGLENLSVKSLGTISVRICDLSHSDSSDRHSFIFVILSLGQNPCHRPRHRLRHK